MKGNRMMNYQNYKGGDLSRTEQVKKPHTITLENRKRLVIEGVSDVIRFDDLSAELSTSLGDLIVEGEQLRIEAFDTERGVVTLTGSIRTLDYLDSKDLSRKGDKKHGIFGKR